MALTSATLGGLSLTGPDVNGIDHRILEMSGWGGTSSTLAPIQKPRQSGAWGGTAYLKPRSVVLRGETVLPSPDLALVAVDSLVQAATLGVTSLSVVEAGVTRTAYVRRDGEVIAQWKPGGDLIVSWSIQLVALDPRKFGAELTGSTGLPSSTGGLTVPFTVPFTIASTVVSGQVTLVNPGNVAGPVRLRIDGPVSAPIVTHVGSGRALVFSSSLVLAAGEFVTVDMERHEVLAQGQSSRNGWVTGRGWSSFEPGSNTFSFASPVADPAASLSVYATPAWE